MTKQWQTMTSERTLMLIKPDAIRRGLIGSILQRIEQTGLKIVACKMVFPSKEQLEGHFPSSDDWIRGMGKKTLETYKEYGLNPIEHIGTDDPFVIGQKIKKWNFDYLGIGPIMIIVLEGIHAINTTRKLIGNTLPYKANPGTIRGDFSINAADLANVVGSACKNLVHASGNIQEARQEINNWFDPDELLSWERTDDFLHFIRGEFTQLNKGEKTMEYNKVKTMLDSLKEKNPREAAEYAYVLAQLYKNTGNNEEATKFGKESIRLFDQCRMETMEDCAAINVTIEGIAIPDLIHQDVVRNRLQLLKI